MRPLRTRLEEARGRTGIGWETLERDYVLSWVLAGLAHIPELREGFVFKGGTALKKCYFGEYRFSEDLDFSSRKGLPTGDALEDAVRGACAVASDLLDEYAPVTLVCERYTERRPHPGGQEAFTIRAQLPWHRRPQVPVMVEVSVDEPLLWPAVDRAVIHGYGEPLDVRVRTYALEEILAEKLRAILQHVERLERRGWARSRARDYYDLWRVFQDYGERLQLDGFASRLHQKCAVREVGFEGPGDFFQEAMLRDVRNTWHDWLGALVVELPSFDVVVGDLRQRVVEVLTGQRGAS